MIIMLDGPEKAGKSTLAKAILAYAEWRDIPTHLRNWGPVKPDDRVYTPALQEDTVFPGIVVWDRGWAAEHVYGKLLHRDRRLANDPWLGEWLHGRAVQSVGTRVMVIADPALLASRRDDTDLPVNPVDEVRLFKRYAQRFGWMILDTTDLTIPAVGRNAAYIVGKTTNGFPLPYQRPPAYAGPVDAPVLVVGDARNDTATMPGSWLPFSSDMTTMFGRLFGDHAMEIGWTNAADLNPRVLQYRQVVVACGQRAINMCRKYEQEYGFTLHGVAHPSYAYRWNTDVAAAKRTEAADVVKKLLEAMQYRRLE